MTVHVEITDIYNDKGKAIDKSDWEMYGVIDA